MKYFTNCKTLEELRKEYKRLVKENHPDNGGSEDAIKVVNVEDELIQKLNQITEIATERQKAAEKIIKDHEKWERKFFKRIFKKGIDNKQ